MTLSEFYEIAREAAENNAIACRNITRQVRKLSEATTKEEKEEISKDLTLIIGNQPPLKASNMAVKSIMNSTGNLEKLEQAKKERGAEEIKEDDKMIFDNFFKKDKTPKEKEEAEILEKFKKMQSQKKENHFFAAENKPETKSEDKSEDKSENTSEGKSGDKSDEDIFKINGEEYHPVEENSNAKETSTENGREKQDYG